MESTSGAAAVDEASASHSFADPSILLPPEVLQNLDLVTDIAVDIGGSLAKVALFMEGTPRRRLSSLREGEADSAGGNERASVFAMEHPRWASGGKRLYLTKFETMQIATLVRYVRANMRPGLRFIKATGGGAHLFKEMLEHEVGAKVVKLDEMDCLIAGCNFLLKHIRDEAFAFNLKADVPRQYHNPANPGDVFPYLLVNIGSGVSMVKVESERVSERIGGTSLGGGTFWGLCSLLTDARGFDAMLELSKEGNSRNVDMLVGDIYGRDYSKIGLPADVIASSFGKAARSSDAGDRAMFAQADIAKSLLHMIANNIGQIAYLMARLHQLRRIYFGGFFIRGHPYTMHAIHYAINYWSKGEIDALFLRHEGYLGAVGAFLAANGGPDSAERGSWDENFALAPRTTAEPVSVLEQLDARLVPFPKLRPGSAYVPDTVDLSCDARLREYWFGVMRASVDGLCALVKSEYGDSDDVRRRADEFAVRFADRLDAARESPGAFGTLSVRALFELRQFCLVESELPDVYGKAKRRDNEAALACLVPLLERLAALPEQERRVVLLEGLLAGNMYDWDASAILELRAGLGGELAFEAARSQLRKPWLRNGAAAWSAALDGRRHAHACIFVDNSGADIVLGVLPFAMDLAERGIRVTLAANSQPAANDVTAAELRDLLREAGQLVPRVDALAAAKFLSVEESGCASPCLDLGRVDEQLALACADVDLVVLVGMGRAIHTNWRAGFSCDALKVAVLKNREIAAQLGGSLFDVVCLFEPTGGMNGGGGLLE